MSLAAALTIAKNYRNGGRVETNPPMSIKKHVNFQGLQISIETPKGQIRRGIDHEGKPWANRMAVDYGYIRRTEGKDGDQVDCFVGPNRHSDKVFVIDQLHHHMEKFDEHKCLVGFNNKKQALTAYHASYGRKYGSHHTVGAVTELSIDAFKEWLKGGGGKKPVSPEVPMATGGAAKATKETANYRLGTKAEHCGICSMFRLPDSCTAVEGKIRPQDTCDYFEKIKKYQAGGGIEDVPGVGPTPISLPNIPEPSAIKAYREAPSWLEQAQQYAQRGAEAYQREGVSGLMSDTGIGQELAGGFGGTTIGKVGIARALPKTIIPNFDGPSPHAVMTVPIERISTGTFDPIEVLVNPSVSQIRKLSRENPYTDPSGHSEGGVRQMGDIYGNLYIWRSDLGLHDAMGPALKAEGVKIDHSLGDSLLVDDNKTIYPGQMSLIQKAIENTKKLKRDEGNMATGGKIRKYTMPLKPGSSEKVKSQNISEFHTGPTYAHTKAKFGKAKADAQAVAVALSNARKYGKKKAFGGPNIESMIERGSIYNLRREGMINSTIPGRTDKHPMNVPAGSYVLPADIPSALGQGNTMAGGEILKKMFSSGPYGMPLMRGAPRGPRPPRLNLTPRMRADGGKADDDDSHVPIIAAGGEFLIPPEVVKDIGHGNINAGHRVLDAFVLRVRKKNVDTLKKLPEPKK